MTPTSIGYATGLAAHDIEMRPMVIRPSGTHRASRATRSVIVALTLSALHFTAYGATMNTADIKLNPSPRMRYEVTAAVEGAPGPFDAIDAAVDYKVSDRHCVPLTPITGAAMFPEKRVPVVLHPLGNNIYRGEIFLDLLQDQDYFGKGTCHWEVVGTGVSFRKGDVSFATDLFRDDILAQHRIERFFSNRSYVTSTPKRVDTGNEKRSDFEDEAPHTFSISVKAEEKLP